MRVASNFPTAYVRVASQTYVLQHIIEKTSVPPSLTYPLPRWRPGPQAGLDVGDGYRGLQGPDAGLQLAHGQTHAQPHHPLHAQGDDDILQVDEDEYCNDNDDAGVLRRPGGERAADDGGAGGERGRADHDRGAGARPQGQQQLRARLRRRWPQTLVVLQKVPSEGS